MEHSNDVMAKDTGGVSLQCAMLHYGPLLKSIFSSLFFFFPRIFQTGGNGCVRFLSTCSKNLIQNFRFFRNNLSVLPGNGKRAKREQSRKKGTERPRQVETTLSSQTLNVRIRIFHVGFNRFIFNTEDSERINIVGCYLLLMQ